MSLARALAQRALARQVVGKSSAAEAPAAAKKTATMTQPSPAAGAPMSSIRAGPHHTVSAAPGDRLVSVERFGPLAVITFNGKYKDATVNPMTPLMGDQIQEVVTDLSKPGQGLGCVVMTGVRQSFLAGGHYRDFFLPRIHVAAPKTVESRQENTDFMFNFFNNFLSPRLKLAVPVIAAVNGPCIGAGLGVALGADIRVACAEHAKFSANFVKLGVQPGTGVSYTLPLFVGRTHATRMMLTGEMVDVERAERIGLVSESVPLEYHSEEVRKLLQSKGKLDYYESAPGVLVKALELALDISRCEPGAVRSTLRTIRTLEEGDFLHGQGVKEYPKMRRGAASESLLLRQLRREAVEQSLSWQNEGFRAWVTAIQEKRTPQYELMGLYEKTPYEKELFDRESQEEGELDFWEELAGKSSAAEAPAAAKKTQEELDSWEEELLKSMAP